MRNLNACDCACNGVSLDDALETIGNSRISHAEKRRRRMALSRLYGRHTVLEWELMKVFCGNRCVRCGTDEYRVEKDHILPVYQGGLDLISNIQPLCARCNSSIGPDRTDYRPSGWAAFIRANS